MRRVDLIVESLRDGDLEAQHGLARQAFNAQVPYDPEVPVPSADRIVAGYDGDELVGAVVTLDFDMTWAGQPIPCGGVSGVAVAPEHRGVGIARRLMRESLERMRDRGEVLAALYPTTASLYRSVGFEVAGWYRWRHVGLDLLDPARADTLDWRRADLGDDQVRTVHEVMAARTEGWFRMDDVWWGRTWARFGQDPRTNRYVYVGSRGDEPAAAVVYRYTESDVRLYEIGVDLLAGVDDAAVGAALGFLARNGTTAGRIETTLPAELLALHVPQAQLMAVQHEWPWMLRLVDVTGAMAQRAAPTAVTGSVALQVDDPDVEGNAGEFVLEVADGGIHLSPGGDGRVQVAVRDLAAIYAGADVRRFADAGRLPGALPGDVELLAATFTTHPTMPFFF